MSLGLSGHFGRTTSIRIGHTSFAAPPWCLELIQKRSRNGPDVFRTHTFRNVSDPGMHRYT